MGRSTLLNVWVIPGPGKVAGDVRLSNGDGGTFIAEK